MTAPSPLEWLLKDLKSVPWIAIGKVLNSRMGMALFVWIILNYGYGSKLESIERNTDKMAEALAETRTMSNINHELLVRLMERCEVRLYHGPDTTRAAQLTK